MMGRRFLCFAGYGFLLAWLACCPLLLSASRWLELASVHFVLYTDTSESKGRRLLGDLESRVEWFSRTFRKAEARQFPIEIFLFDRSEDFLGATPEGLSPIDESAYLHRGPDRVFIVARDKSPEDLSNDVGHALGHVLFERVVLWRPFWLAEGVAEYTRKLGHDPDKESIAREEGFSVGDLLKIVPSPTFNDREAGGVSRRQSYRLVRILLRDRPAELRKYVETLRTEAGSTANLEIDHEAASGQLFTHVETPAEFSSKPAEIRVLEVGAETISARRGDLLLAAGRAREAGPWYSGESREARVGRAILSKFTRPLNEARRALESAVRDFPESGLALYYYGTLEARQEKQTAAQIKALERAVELLPRMGRVHAALAKLYAASGAPAKALPLVRRAIELEPEFADHFYEILADVQFEMGQLDEAYGSIKLAEALPHTGRSSSEYFARRVSSLRRDIENRRRMVESGKVAVLRKEVEAEVTRREPPPPPEPPPIPVPPGRITYVIESRLPSGVTAPAVLTAVFPEYPESLRKNSAQGEIVLRLDVDQNGIVKGAVVVRSKLPELDQATMDAVRQWTFNPARRAGRVIPSKLNLTITFTLQ